MVFCETEATLLKRFSIFLYGGCVFLHSEAPCWDQPHRELKNRLHMNILKDGSYISKVLNIYQMLNALVTFFRYKDAGSFI